MSKLSSEAGSARVATFYLENLINGQGNTTQLKLAKNLIQTAMDAEERVWLETNTYMRLKLIPGMTLERSQELARVVLNEKYRIAALGRSRSASAGGEKPS